MVILVDDDVCVPRFFLFKNHRPMIKQITPFQYGENQLRTVNENSQPFFLAIDACHLLGLSNTTRALEKLDDDEKLCLRLVMSGQEREVLAVNESGLYH